MIAPERLEPGLRAWLARLAELEAELPPAPPGDLAARRARERELSDRLAAEFVAPVRGAAPGTTGIGHPLRGAGVAAGRGVAPDRGTAGGGPTGPGAAHDVAAGRGGGPDHVEVAELELPVGPGLFALRFTPGRATRHPRPDGRVGAAGAPAHGSVPLLRRGDPAGRGGHRSAAPLPTQLFLHGGGFVSGTTREVVNTATLTRRAARSGVQIVSLDYRLAPEHPYPAALEDVLATLALLRAEPERWGVDPERLGVGGHSAGGHLAIVAGLRLRDAGAPVAHVLAEVPALDLGDDERPSMRELPDAAELAGLRAAADAYRGDRPAEHPDLSPVHAPDLRGLPPTLVMTAEFDPLRDAAEEFAHRAAAAGSPVRLRRGAGQLHGTSFLTAAAASSRAWQDAAAAELRAAYATA